MSFMESIRTKGQYFLLAFLVIFVVTLFFGLTGGNIFNPRDLFRDKQDKQQINGPSGREPLLTQDAGADVSMLVNSQPVKASIYDDFVRRFEDMLNGQKRDTANYLTAYGYAANAIADQEAKLQEAKRLGLTVTDADFAKAKRDASANFLSQDSKTTGNVVGDLVKDYNDARALKAAFAQYLETTGMTEQTWEAQIRRELLANKVKDAIKSRLDEEEKADLDKKKAEVDAKLAGGTSFAAVADEFSDDKAQSGKGGDMGWVGWSLLQDGKQRDAIWAVEKGKVSDWIEVDAGWQKVEVYDKKVASGPDFDKEKPAIIKRLKDTKKDQSGYEPTDDEIKHEYEQVALRQIMLRKNAQQKAYEEEDKLTKAAKVEINNAYALAWQALNGDKLQPPSAFGYDKLVELAKANSAAAEGYDFSPIKAKLEKGQPVEAAEGKAEGGEAGAAKAAETSADAKGDKPAGAETQAKGQDGATAGGQAAGGGSAAATGDKAAQAGADGAEAAAKTDSAPETVSMGAPAADASVPMYALAIALLTKGLADDNGAGANFAHYMIAKTYMDWMNDSARLKDQPIDREKARLAMEDHLKAAAESDNYNALVHAYRGLNLAWLEKKEDAIKSLDLALKYASDDDLNCFDTVRQAYEVLDDQAKLSELDQKLADIRQRKLQEMLNQSMREQAEKAGAGNPPAGGQPGG